MKAVFKHLLSILLVVAFILLTMGCDESLSSEASGDIYDFDIIEDVGFINDEFDAGAKITFTLKNVGESGIIKIMPKLSCSEGEWTREQSVILNAGESREFTYFFHEPTINATNIQGSVSVYP